MAVSIVRGARERVDLLHRAPSASAPPATVGHVNAFFDALGRRFRAAAERRGAAIEPPQLDAAEARELLDLTRVIAHTEERRFAPLAAFVAGVAVERMRAAGVAPDAEAVAAVVREIREELEAPGDG